MRKIARFLGRYWYVWASLVFVYFIEGPGEIQAVASLLSGFLNGRPLLVALLGFLAVVLLIPNFVAYRLLERYKPEWVHPKEYPTRYFESMRTANNSLLVTAGVIIGFFRISGARITILESRLLLLVFASAFAGLVALISQVTPSISPGADALQVKALPLTKHIIFIGTYFQATFLVLGFYEAFLAVSVG